jgi:hypothetical protein
MADLADLASAEAEGYFLAQGYTPEGGYTTHLEKVLSGEPDHRMVNMRADGASSVDQATADATALAVLNAQRAFRYGDGPEPNSGIVDQDFTHVPDET